MDRASEEHGVTPLGDAAYWRARAEKAEAEMLLVKTECDEGRCPWAQHERLAAIANRRMLVLDAVQMGFAKGQQEHERDPDRDGKTAEERLEQLADRLLTAWYGEARP